MHLKVAALTLPGALLAILLPARADDARLKAYGRHLSQECTSCHRVDGAGQTGIPPISGWEPAAFVKALTSYRDGARTNAVMKSVAGSLDDQQMQALATYWGSLPKAATKNPH